MEAYKLFAKDFYNIFFAKKTLGNWIGRFNCLLFGIASLILTGWAIYGIFDSHHQEDPYAYTTTTLPDTTTTYGLFDYITRDPYYYNADGRYYNNQNGYDYARYEPETYYNYNYYYRYHGAFMNC